MNETELTPEILLHDVEDIVENYDVNYIDALLSYCEKNGYDVESISKIIPASLICSLEQTAKKLHLLKPQYNNATSLPL